MSSMSRKTLPPATYDDYLHLPKILSSQNLRSEMVGAKAHEEMLFIIVHQTYELWFKQILHELDSVIELFRTKTIDERNMGVAVSRLERITQIQKLLLEQLSVLESMTALDFLEFRNLLVPASGFQSTQFRQIENKLGLDANDRVNFEDVRAESFAQAGSATSLLSLVEKWLERTPFLNFSGFDFVTHFRSAVNEMLTRDEEIIQKNTMLSSEGRERQLKILAATRNTFAAVLDENAHKKLVEAKKRKLSFKAMQAALLIFLYQDQPILHLPFRLLSSLLNIDEALTTWRYRHALMARRMIGTKIGTGGSSGHEYLKLTAERHKIFADFFDLSSLLVPRSALPELPQSIQNQLGFHYSVKS